MEAWGGIECSINRVGDNYFDQFIANGLYQKPELLNTIFGLGIKTLRFPILWEKNWEDENTPPNWAIEDQLKLLRENKINIIAGLVHHGSGPRYAEIQSDGFAEKLAEYAKKVALKFPWIDDYTPINEPLTTARFCGLYGLWYPHAKDSRVFLKILINECKATILAMRAIREVNPNARLVFTEDLTKIHGTTELKSQTDFENDRRWLSIDLLCGKVKNGHPLWEYLMQQEISEVQLRFFTDNPMPPDVLGFNYYVTSERYLDHNLDGHPPVSHGGNGIISYADIEAVRHPDAAIAGIANLLREAWERYNLPMAITEAHLCCGREDQLRWLKSIWDACSTLNTQGIKVIAVTFWSLFGAYGWDKLLTEEKGTYESGAFDVSSGNARPTAIAKLIEILASNQLYSSPVIDGRGWWQRESTTAKNIRPVLILGGSGTLGSAFAKICIERNISFIAPTRKKLDISKPEQISSIIEEHQPWAIINAAGFVNVEAAEQEVEACFLANTIGPLNLAEICKTYAVQLLSFSSDLVFDGTKTAPYIENDSVHPLNIYGLSKAEAERQLMSHYPDTLIVRTSAFFGPWDKYNFVAIVLESLKKSNRFSAMDDVYITATYVPHLVHASLDLLIDQQSGIWHLSNSGKVSWYELAVDIAQKAGYDANTIQRISQYESNLLAKRPKNSSLESSKGVLMPTLEKGLDEYFHYFPELLPRVAIV